MPVAAIAACVGGVLIWTMAVHDPYWRLFQTASLPAPDYESPAEIEAALAAATVLARLPDSTAVRPDAGVAPEPQGAPVALAPRSAEPVIAVPMPLSLDQPTELAGDPGAVPRDPDSIRPVALAPAPLPQPEPARTGAPVIAALAPVSVATSPAPLWVAADEASEDVLALTPPQRSNVQRRLALAGFDPKGFDGVFGPRTRQAIADFQAAWGFPATGYLDSAAHAELRARTEEAYAALETRAAREPRAAPKLAPVARERQLAANDADGCTRDAAGRIVERQSFGCDLKGLAEKVISLGRNKLAHEEATEETAGEAGGEAVAEPNGMAVAAGTRPAVSSGVDR